MGHSGSTVGDPSARSTPFCKSQTPKIRSGNSQTQRSHEAFTGTNQLLWSLILQSPSLLEFCSLVFKLKRVENDTCCKTEQRMRTKAIFLLLVCLCSADVELDEDGFVKSFSLEEVQQYREFFDEHGFAVIRNVLERPQIEETISEMW